MDNKLIFLFLIFLIFAGFLIFSDNDEENGEDSSSEPQTFLNEEREKKEKEAKRKKRIQEKQRQKEELIIAEKERIVKIKRQKEEKFKKLISLEIVIIIVLTIIIFILVKFFPHGYPDLKSLLLSLKERGDYLKNFDDFINSGNIQLLKKFNLKGLRKEEHVAKKEFFFNFFETETKDEGELQKLEDEKIKELEINKKIQENDELNYQISAHHYISIEKVENENGFVFLLKKQTKEEYDSGYGPLEKKFFEELIDFFDSKTKKNNINNINEQNKNEQVFIDFYNQIVMEIKDQGSYLHSFFKIFFKLFLDVTVVSDLNRIETISENLSPNKRLFFNNFIKKTSNNVNSQINMDDEEFFYNDNEDFNKIDGGSKTTNFVREKLPFGIFYFLDQNLVPIKKIDNDKTINKIKKIDDLYLLKEFLFFFNLMKGIIKEFEEIFDVFQSAEEKQKNEDWYKSAAFSFGPMGATKSNVEEAKNKLTNLFNRFFKNSNYNNVLNMKNEDDNAGDGNPEIQNNNDYQNNIPNPNQNFENGGEGNQFVQ